MRATKRGKASVSFHSKGVRYKPPDRQTHSGIEVDPMAATLLQKCTAMGGQRPARAVQIAISIPKTTGPQRDNQAFSPA